MKQRLPRRSPDSEAELVADEIEDLERPPLRSWGTWCLAFGGFGLLALIVSGFMFWEAAGRARSVAAREAEIPPAEIALQDVEHGLEVRPQVFRWTAVPGCAGYILMVHALERDEIVLMRAQRENYVTTTDVESANLVAGRYAWSVEARRADGTRLGYGRGTLVID